MKTLWLFYTSFVASSSSAVPDVWSPASGSGLRPLPSAFSLARCCFQPITWSLSVAVIRLSDLFPKSKSIVLSACRPRVRACVPGPARLDPSGSLRRQTLCNNLAFRNLKQGCKQTFVLLSVKPEFGFWFRIRRFFFLFFSFFCDVFTDLSPISSMSTQMQPGQNLTRCSCVVFIQNREICPSVS